MVIKKAIRTKRQLPKTQKQLRVDLSFYPFLKIFPEPILVTTDTGSIWYANPAWENLTGYKLREVEGKKPTHVITSGRTEGKVNTQLWERLQTGKPFITDALIDRTKDGTTLNLHAAFFPLTIKHSVFYVQVLRDITEMMQIRKQLKESEKRMLSIIDNARGYAIYLLDHKGFIKSWNKGAEIMSGYTQEEVQGKHISQFYTKKDISENRAEKGLTKAQKYGKFEDEMERVRKDGELYYARISISSITNDKKELVGFVQITHDITLQKKLEKQRDDFITMASHVLKTPITSMKMYGEILERKITDEGQKNLALLTQMNTQTNKLMRVIDELLHADTIMTNHWDVTTKSVDLNKLLTSTVREIQETTTTHKILLTGQVTTHVLLDKKSIRTVLKKLLSNAIKHSPDADKITITVTQNEQYAIIAIQDFGYGIPQGDMPELFQKFYQTKTKQEKHIQGMGLGLYITSEIIKLHHGNIWVQSEVGKGSTFYFSLPLDKNVG
ncbi:MAG TPA: PAS domain S-box protein [Candidatus Saccharimonadales bacterium]|nr:PAS domain S-box protein [Candidatus Saccharimonadales bacterium]